MLVRLVALGLVCVLSSCTHHQLASLSPANPRDAAHMYVIALREHGSDSSAWLLIIDGEAAAVLADGEYTAVALQPGPHLLSTGCELGWGLAWQEERLPVILDPREEYFYQLAPGGTCGRHLTGVDASAGRMLAAEATYVPTEQQRGASPMPTLVSLLHGGRANIT